MVKIKELARMVGGVVIGDGDVAVGNISGWENATEKDITFAFDEEGLKKAAECKAPCVLAMESVEKYKKTILKVPNMKEAVTIIYNVLSGSKVHESTGVHPTALIAKTAKVAGTVSIGPNAVIGERAEIGERTIIKANSVIGENVRIGSMTVIEPNVTVYANSVIGNKVLIHAGVVIGADGFGFITKGDTIYKVPQLGKAVIEDNVEIGANSCVDRGTFADTVVGAGSKLDNEVQIAHNVKIGKNVLIAALTGIGGSATVGDNTMIGGLVGIADHVKIGRDVKIGGKTGVTGSVPDGTVVFGYPHREAAEIRKMHALFTLMVERFSGFKKFLRGIPK